MRYGALQGSEYEADLADLKADDDNVSYSPGVSRAKALVALIVIVVASLCFSSYKTYSSSKVPTQFTTLTGHNKLLITATNEYGAYEGPYPWLDTIPGSQIVEPHKLTMLTAINSAPAKSISFYRWSFSDKVVVQQNSSSRQCNVTITALGNHDVTVEAYDDKNNLVSSFSTLLMCKYVKREIRSLTIDDRERFLDAAAAIWKYNQGDGEALFGSKFTSIGNFVATHSRASNDYMCDQFHDGTGFLTHHLALTNSFEAAIRSVDPSVTLPYWDFTVEGQTISDLEELPSYMTKISPVFSETWFGEVDGNNHIKNSRWAHTLMPRQQDATSGVRNSYGYIRSYWNNNPDKEITRHLFDICGIEAVQKQIPNCAKHYEILRTDNLGQFLLKAPGDGHGPVHVAIGGMWGGCTDAYKSFVTKWSTLLYSNLTQTEVDGFGLPRAWTWGMESPRKKMLDLAVIGEYFHIYRSLWRSHMCAVDGTPQLLVCPPSCDPDTPFEECHCQVDALVKNETTWQNLLPCIIGSSTAREEFLASTPDEFLSDLVHMVSTAPVLEGDMIESSSPADIIFWLIHPCIERLLSAKRLDSVISMNKLPIPKWSKGEHAFYNNVNYECYGHSANSTIMAASQLTDIIERYADENGDGLVSNWEFYRVIDPNRSEFNDYVFDHFEWDHCHDTLEDLLE